MTTSIHFFSIPSKFHENCFQEENFEDKRRDFNFDLFSKEFFGGFNRVSDVVILEMEASGEELSSDVPRFVFS